MLLLFRNFFQFFRKEHPALVLLIETLHEFGVFSNEFHVGCIFRFHQEFINLLLSRFQFFNLRLTFLHGFLSLADLLLDVAEARLSAVEPDATEEPEVLAEGEPAEAMLWLARA